MANGPLYIVDYHLQDILRAIDDLDSHTLKGILMGNSQAVTRSFVGGSGLAKYSDLTGELATANGYTAGGVTVTGATFSRLTTTLTNDTVKFTADYVEWAITPSAISGIKYFGIYDDSTADKELLMVMDFDTSGGTIIGSAGGVVRVSPHVNGIFRAVQS